MTTETPARAAAISPDDRATYWRAYHAAGGDARAAARTLGLPDAKLVNTLASMHGWPAEIEAIREEKLRAVRSTVAEHAPEMELVQRAVVGQAGVTEQALGDRLRAEMAKPTADAKDIAALVHAKTEQGRLAIEGGRVWAETWGLARPAPATAVQVNVDARTQTIETFVAGLSPERVAELLAEMRTEGTAGGDGS